MADEPTMPDPTPDPAPEPPPEPPVYVSTPAEVVDDPLNHQQDPGRGGGDGG